VLAAFDTHIFWEALRSRPYWTGALLAIELTCVSLAAACVIGFFLALGRASRFRIVRGIVFFYNWIFRATPTLLQLIFAWYSLPQFTSFFAGSWFRPFLAAFIVLSLNEAAYMSEIIRAGLLSVDPGQELAGRALGMTRGRILRRVVVPQAVRIIIPPTGNEFITLLKLTSLASVISLHELLTASQVRATFAFNYAEAYSAAVVYYLVIVSILMVAQAQLEKRFTWRSARRRSRGAGRLPRRAVNDAVLRAEDVHKSYDGLQVLRGVSIDVGRGKVKVIIGPSGSGKSTLLRCLALLEPVDSGEVYLDGERLSGVRERELAKHRSEVGMVFQRFNLFQNMTALRNVMTGLVDVRRLPKREARERALEFLDRVGLADKADNYPEELSGGQQQRVAIARALVMRPKAMLFDEPTSALDVELVREVLDVMEALARDGMTMVVVSHELRFAQHVANSILMMDEGTIIEEAPPERFFSSPSHERTRRFLALVE
jgi:polar amino acid transport system permease protein